MNRRGFLRSSAAATLTLGLPSPSVPLFLDDLQRSVDNPIIKPIEIDGKSYYQMWIDPKIVDDLRSVQPLPDDFWKEDL